MDKATIKMLDKAKGMLGDAKNIIQSVAEQARDKFEGLSEKSQESDKGLALDGLADGLEEMDGSLDDMINELGDLINEK